MKLEPFREYNESEVVSMPSFSTPGSLPNRCGDFLTQDEHEIIEALGKINTRMCKICDEPLDRQEICALIHALQARVMSHAAARAYPGLYRKL